MTLAETVRATVNQDDARKAGEIVESLRLSGYRYAQILEIFTRITGISATEFDALMYEADEITSRS